MNRTLEADWPNPDDFLVSKPHWFDFYTPKQSNVAVYITSINILTFIIHLFKTQTYRDYFVTLRKWWIRNLTVLTSTSTELLDIVVWMSMVSDSYVGCRRALQWWGSSNSQRRHCICLGALGSTCPLSERMAEQHIWSSVHQSRPKDTWQWTYYIWKLEKIWDFS